MVFYHLFRIFVSKTNYTYGKSEEGFNTKNIGFGEPEGHCSHHFMFYALGILK